MNTLQTFLKTPLAATIVIGSALLIGLGGCKKKSEEPTENAPPASATAAAPAPASTAGGAMASDTTGMGTPASSASSAADMSGTTPGAETAGMGAPAEVTTGPITDTQFYTQAMAGDQKEIATAQMVAGQSTDADVKSLASKILGDHQAFDKKVQAAAGAGVTPPTGEVDSSLQGKTGKDLDKAYVDAMVSDHEKDIPMFENAAKNASTPGARKLASEALPTLRSHLKSAQELQKKMGATS